MGYWVLFWETGAKRTLSHPISSLYGLNGSEMAACYGTDEGRNFPFFGSYTLHFVIYDTILHWEIPRRDGR
jgi:hypothetical protein